MRTRSSHVASGFLHPTRLWRRRRRHQRLQGHIRQGSHQDLVFQQRRRGEVGQAGGRRLERLPPERAGERRGDPGRQELRGGHRRLDHRRQHPLPGLQHRAGRGAPVPEAGRAGRARLLQRRSLLHPAADRAASRPVQVAGRQVLPDAVEDQPGDDLLQQAGVPEGGHQHRQPSAQDLQRVPADGQDGGRKRRRQGGHLAGAVQRVLPALVRLLPAVHRPDRQAAGGGRPAPVQQPGRGGRGQLLEAALRPEARPQGALQR